MRFTDKKEAKKHIKLANAGGNLRKNLTGHYWCEQCECFHVTSKKVFDYTWKPASYPLRDLARKILNLYPRVV